MKRKVYRVSDHTRSKKRKLWKRCLPRKKYNWVAATKTYNYMVNDTIVDWITEHGTRYSSNTKNGFKSFIMKRGIEFERELVKYIHKNKTPVISVSEHITKDSIQKTKKLMLEGVPVIHSAPVKNYRNKTQGVIDLIVRSDYLHHILNESPLTEKERNIKAPKLKGNYHYVIVDIKFSTLPLRANGKNILNSGNFPAYSGCYFLFIFLQSSGVVTHIWI